ncbi:lytic transglycosylase domain-containing protein [Achromobacter mucicolens]|uniref:lytic transglycosylase domain-containing protein n=1 Tax=Achromobacter mucicolens TaxID=1389922 RepID=UPI00244B781C|nr:lytic transglycosylase domain-containing protein [Achromobacter mucicolens]MDH0090887.1 lytic transglycosylase domain-containing protein [Achromobacter mucicolens]
MDMPTMDFPALARQCAPDVHISTLAAVVRHESAFNPLVIGVNSKPHRSIRPASRQEAVQEVRKLIDQGVNFDVGYGQINVRNWKWLGVTPETIFDPCVNLASAQRVLVNCYQRAQAQHGRNQAALYAAFSCYNTGNLIDGFRNGYVGRVLAGAGMPVPALAEDPRAARSSAAPGASAPTTTRATSTRRPQAFEGKRNDAFATPRRDAFTKTDRLSNDVAGNDDAPAVFGAPVARPRPLAPQ